MKNNITFSLEQPAFIINKKTDDRPHRFTEIFYFETSEEKELSFSDNKIVFVRKGAVVCSFDSFPDRNITEGQFFILPAGYNLTIKALDDSSILSVDMPEWSQNFSISSLAEKEGAVGSEQAEHLESNDILDGYLNSLETYMQCGMDSQDIIQAKQTELLYILFSFYTKEELYCFFILCLTDEYRFRRQVRINYRKARNVLQLAEMMHYSYSGFNKRFKKVFGVSAYSWMQQQKAGLIYRELSLGGKSLKEISSDFGFLSLSHFNEFCHKELGASPSEIRRRSIKKERILN